LFKADEGKLVLKAPDLGFEEDAPEADVRERHVIYAKSSWAGLWGSCRPRSNRFTPRPSRNQTHSADKNLIFVADGRRPSRFYAHMPAP